MSRRFVRTTNGRPLLLAVVGQTATGKSSLALSLAEYCCGEIISCDSTAVYRGFDVGTDKVPLSDRRGVQHHLVDVVAPTESYSAARYGQDAARIAREITARQRLPIVVGGSGLYYRALSRGLFPGPGRDPAIRSRLTRVARGRGVEKLHQLLARHDPHSADRIQSRDEKRLIRALEVYMLTGRTLTDHFASTRSPVADYSILTVGLCLPGDLLRVRIAERVDRQFNFGLIEEVKSLLAKGVPPEAGPLGGLVYRQVLEYLRGARGLDATRRLIVRENQRYARRQLIWFKKEPNLQWIRTPGEHSDTGESVRRLLDVFVTGSTGG